MTKDLFVEKTSGFFENRQLFNVVSIYYSLDIDRAFLPYVYECVRSGPFLKRSPFCSSHTDAVWSAGELFFGDQSVQSWPWKLSHIRDKENFWHPHGRRFCGFEEPIDGQRVWDMMDKYRVFLLQFKAKVNSGFISRVNICVFHKTRNYSCTVSRYFEDKLFFIRIK